MTVREFRSFIKDFALNHFAVEYRERGGRGGDSVVMSLKACYDDVKDREIKDFYYDPVGDDDEFTDVCVIEVR